MSIADHFEHAPDAGFIRSYDSQAARRQFQVSIVLIVVLSVAVFALGLLVRSDRTTGASVPTQSAHETGFA